MTVHKAEIIYFKYVLIPELSIEFQYLYLLEPCICSGNEVTGVIGNIHVCSLSMKISGAGHDLLSTCRYQTNNSIHISPTIHSNCSLTSTNYNWKIYWLNNQDALVNIEKHMVDLTMEDNAPFTIPSAYVLEAEADSKGIFALSLKMDFELNGINTNSEQKVCLIVLTGMFICLSCTLITRLYIVCQRNKMSVSCNPTYPRFFAYPKHSMVILAQAP